MPLPQKRWFRIAEIAKRWNMQVGDIEDYALDDILELGVFVADLPVEAGRWESAGNAPFRLPHEQMILNGPQPLLRASLLQIFRVGHAEIAAFRTRDPSQYLLVRARIPALVVNREELIVTREERDRFEREHALTNDTGDPSGAEFAHGENFTRIRIAGEWHKFGPKQAAVLRLLKAAGESDNPWRDGKTLLADADAATMRLIDLFKRKPVWRKLVIADGKGRYRIAPAMLSPERRRLQLFRRTVRANTFRRVPNSTAIQQSRVRAVSRG